MKLFDFLKISLLCTFTTTILAAQSPYSDGRPMAKFRMDAKDQGIVFTHGEDPNHCDIYGSREALIFQENGIYHLFYDGAGPKGWLACLATSTDLIHWKKLGHVLDFGQKGEMDSGSAGSPWVYFDAGEWHMFYLGTPNTLPAPYYVPHFPYLTLKAKSYSLTGPWVKQKDIIPFQTKQGTYYSITASPGYILKYKNEYLQFFSCTTRKEGHPLVLRTLGIARTRDLNGVWAIDPAPILPVEEQIENSFIYFESSNNTWFLFTNHIGVDDIENTAEKNEYTDAVWVYWSKDPNKWDAQNKAVVLDGENCLWSKKCIGMPSVIRVGQRLALLYDAPGGISTSHMHRNIGLAWLNLPLIPPMKNTDFNITRP